MRFLISLHRWWGVLFCLLFAMWFASGIVMHFVPFPARLGADISPGRVAIDLDQVMRGPSEAVAASGIRDAMRVRLMGRRDGPVYVVSGSSSERVVRAADLGDAKIQSERTALDIAVDGAKSRGLDTLHVGRAELTPYDQWTVSGEYDADRPLYRVALNDENRTELYVSSATGNIVLFTTRKVRALSYLGSVVHWLYPTALRRHASAWSAFMWWLSLTATIGAVFGIIIGLWRFHQARRQATSPYRGLHAWHYRVGLAFSPFLLGWIFSGFLSMADARLSSSDASVTEARTLAGAPAWDSLTSDELNHITASSKIIDWFAFDGHIYRTQRSDDEKRELSLVVPRQSSVLGAREYLREEEIKAAAGRLGLDCSVATAIQADDAYRARPDLSGEPVYRVACNETWYEVDGSTGVLLSRTDPLRRTYRGLFNGLHTLDFPVLRSRPALRTTIIVALCLCGFAFSLTGAVLAWRRLTANSKGAPEELVSHDEALLDG